MAHMLFLGEPKAASSHGSVDYNSYYGFPSSSLHLPGKARVAPAFTSLEKFDFKFFPPSTENRPVDDATVGYTSSFVNA